MTTRALKITAVLYVLGYLAHSADHIGRGLDLTPDPTFWTGTIALFPAIWIAWIVARGHVYGPQLAIGLGFLTSVAALAVHIPSDWGPFSQPFRDGVTWLDWSTLLLMSGTAAAFGIAGLAAQSRRRETGGGGAIRTA